MARRRLEAAIQAGQSIAKGKDDTFTKVNVDHNIQLEKEAGGVYSLQYSFDGKLLAIGCGNGTIKLYCTKTGKKLPDVRKSRYGGYPIMVLRFHPKNANMLYAGTSEGQVLGCDISDFVAEDGQIILSHQDSDKDERWSEIIAGRKSIIHLEGQVLSYDISDFVAEDGQIILSHQDSDKDERWSEIITGRKSIIHLEGQVLSYDISDIVAEDGQIILSHQDSDKDERWSIVIAEKQGLEKNEINCMDFDFTYLRFATAGKDLSIRIYDSKTNQIVNEYTGYNNTKDPTDQQFSGCSGRIFALHFHPEYDDIFVTAGWENQVKIWDARSNDGVKRTIHGPHVCGEALDLSKRKILTGSHRGVDALQIWDYSADYSNRGRDGPKPKNVDFPTNGKGPYLYAAQFCDNNVVVAGGSGTNSAMAINTETGNVLGEVKFDHPVQAIDTCLGGRLWAVGDGGRNLKMCSLR